MGVLFSIRKVEIAYTYVRLLINVINSSTLAYGFQALIIS